MNDLVNEIQELSKKLSISINQLAKYGKENALAEKDYKVLLRQECLKLRDEGMAIGMIDKTCYGIPNVANARFKRDVAEVMYKTAQENINVIKLQLRLLENQLQREYGDIN